MSKKNGENESNNFIDFLFKPPKKMTFNALYRYYFDFILRLLYRVIIIDGIPETVNETFLKMILYTQGKICFFRGILIDESKEKLLALNCARADTPTVYYMYRKVIVVNPSLQHSYTLEPGKNCEIVYLSEVDKYKFGEYGGGLYELIRRTAIMLADNDLSLNIAQKNTRLTNIVAADTQNTVDSIRAVIGKMYEGDPTIVVQSSLIDKLQGIPIVENTSQQNMIQLIEVTQYIISHFYESIGICTHDQMKRERLITAEINDNLDLAFLNIDDIVYSLNEGFDRVNAREGTELQARINPIIERQRERSEAALAAQLPDNQEEQLDTQSEEAAAEPEELDAQSEEAGAELEELDAQSEEAGAELEELDKGTLREAAALIVSRILEKAEQPEEEPGEEPEEQPEEEPEEESEEEPEEQPEEESEEEPEEEPEEDSEEEPEEQPEEEPEEEPEQIAENITLDISGDNNIVVIGDDQLDSTPEADELADMGSDHEGGDD